MKESSPPCPRFTQEELLALKILGFEEQKNGYFYHPLTEELFDFSAVSIQGTIWAVYTTGREKGRKDLTQDLKTLLRL